MRVPKNLASGFNHSVIAGMMSDINKSMVTRLLADINKSVIPTVEPPVITGFIADINESIRAGLVSAVQPPISTRLMPNITESLIPNMSAPVAAGFLADVKNSIVTGLMPTLPPPVATRLTSDLTESVIAGWMPWMSAMNFPIAGLTDVSPMDSVSADIDQSETAAEPPSRPSWAVLSLSERVAVLVGIWIVGCLLLHTVSAIADPEVVYNPSAALIDSANALLVTVVGAVLVSVIQQRRP